MALGMWPFTDGLTDLIDVPVGTDSIPIGDALGKRLFANNAVEVYAGTYRGAVGSYVLTVPAGQPIGIVTSYGYDSDANNWWYLYVDNLDRYAGKILGAHFYVPDNVGTMYSLSADIPSATTGLTKTVTGAAKDVADAAMPEIAIVALIVAAVVLGPSLITAFGNRR